MTPNHLIICKDNFKTEEAYEAMVGQAVMMLLKNRQIVTVSYDEPGLGIVDIAYCYDDEAMGCCYPYWLMPDEVDVVNDYLANKD